MVPAASPLDGSYSRSGRELFASAPVLSEMLLWVVRWRTILVRFSGPVSLARGAANVDSATRLGSTRGPGASRGVRQNSAKSEFR